MHPDSDGPRTVGPVTVREVMDTDVVTIAVGADIATAARLMAETRVADVMVLAADGRFVGKVCEGDILRRSMPALDDIVDAGGTLFDGYQAFLRKAHDNAAEPIAPLVIAEPFAVAPDDHVTKALVVLMDRQIRRLPVVDDGRLVGTVSRTHMLRHIA